MISDQLDWPFFEDRHRALDRDVRAWLVAQSQHDEDDVDAACRAWVRAKLGEMASTVDGSALLTYLSLIHI